MNTLKLQNSNEFLIIDDEDFERLSKFKWYIGTRDRIFRTIYEFRKVTKNVSVANEVLQRYDTIFDHRDRNKLNNKKDNLRETDDSKNNANKLKYNYSNQTSKFKGVTKRKDKVFDSRISIRRKTIHLGRFENEEDAARAYDKKASELFGEFAVTNFSQ